VFKRSIVAVQPALFMRIGPGHDTFFGQAGTDPDRDLSLQFSRLGVREIRGA
jgi:hypothetical protein